MNLPPIAHYHTTNWRTLMKTKRLQWGNWILYTSNWELRFIKEGQQLYEIDLETITSSAQMLDWLLQIKGKIWICNDDIADLLQAFKHLFDPQRYLCSFGSDKRISNIPEHIRKVLTWRDGMKSASRGKITQN